MCSYEYSHYRYMIGTISSIVVKNYHLVIRGRKMQGRHDTECLPFNIPVVQSCQEWKYRADLQTYAIKLWSKLFVVKAFLLSFLRGVLGAVWPTHFGHLKTVSRATSYRSLLALQARNRKKKSSKRVFSGLPEKVKKTPKMELFGVFFTLLGIVDDFFCRPPKGSFCDFGPGEPGDSCKWSLGSQIWTLFPGTWSKLSKADWEQDREQDTSDHPSLSTLAKIGNGRDTVSRVLFQKRELAEIFWQTLWVLRRTRWVRVCTQIIGWEELTDFTPQNSVRARKLAELGVWNRTLRNRIRPVSEK